MVERENCNGGWRWLSRVAAGLAAMAFIVMLGMVIDNQLGGKLSDEAMAVLAGAVCGVAVAIPTSLLVIAVARWWKRQVRGNNPA